MSDEEKDQESKRAAKSSRRKGGKQKVTPQDEVLQDFAACPRCSYFWAGYKVIAGDEGIETAVNHQENGWLTLVWSHPMRELVHKSYGVRLDADYFHYEGSCKDCARPFAFAAPEEEKAGSFRIELAPLLDEV